MEVWLAVSGMLALLGGGAGALAYYRKNFGAGSTSAGGGSGTASDPFTPYDLGPTTPIAPQPGLEGIADTISGTTYVDTASGAVETIQNGTVVHTDAGIVSPLPTGIGPSVVKGYVPPAPVVVDTYHAAPTPGQAAAAAQVAATAAQFKANLAKLGI